MDRISSKGPSSTPRPACGPASSGLCIVLLGGFLAWRSCGARGRVGWDAAAPDDAVYAPTSRFVLAAAMFFVYALLLVGRGLPFWLGTGLFVTASCFRSGAPTG